MITEKLSLTSDGLIPHQQLACCHSYCGIPLRGKELLVYSHMDTEQPLHLTGHHGDISAMAFGTGSKPILLCSASADYVIVWDIELCQKRTKEGLVAAGTVIGTLLGEVIHLSFCFSDERVAACSGATVHILSSKRQEVKSMLTGHLGPLTAAEFCPWNKEVLVTISEDRTFKDQPLVFHSKVKSSGYTSSPRLVGLSVAATQYPQEGSRHNRTGAEPGCLNNFQGSAKPICMYAGHDKAVSSVGWSHNRQWWLSASEDRTLRVWKHGSPEPAITMNGDMFSKPIRSAQFYYLDKFLLLASGRSLYLYLYNLDSTRDDIKRYQQRSVVKLAGCFETKSGADITTLSAINDFFSYILLVCGSDRSIQVFDMNKGTVASELPDAHSRAIHCIAQNKGSMFSGQAPESYNLFLTSAVTDGVKVWDLRTLRCIRRYESHLNRCHPCSSAISPCGRFIASGSEDNCAYVYDIRSSSYLHKLQKHSDTVLSVTFNPATPEVRNTLLPFFFVSLLFCVIYISHLKHSQCSTSPNR
uniref:Uncharacterized protein n=1 Tax=Myripristis murdjan TaxID=586833 RepID=A0A667ZLP8_9TELE